MSIQASSPRSDHATRPRGAAARRAVLAMAALTLATAAGLIDTPVAGQAAVPCTAIENDAQRLACYDRALRGATPDAPAAREPTRSPAASAPTESREREREAPAPSARSAPARAAPAAPPAARNGDEDESVSIVIVSLRTVPGRETTFTTDDGTSWVQTDSQRLVGLPDTPFNAELKPGAMGSYFLVPKERGRAIRVRAVQR